MFSIESPGVLEDVFEEIETFPEIERWHSYEHNAITELRQSNQEYWLLSQDSGAIYANCSTKKISIFPAEKTNPAKFKKFVLHNWLPMIYQVCGSQVVHASAVLNSKSRKIVSFCGDSGCGKSTLAYGFSLRKSWQQISDDRLAFQVNGGKVSPIYIPDNIQLRPQSADHFGEKPFSSQSCEWEDGLEEISTILFVEQIDSPNQINKPPFEISPIVGVDAFELLLKQAFALSPAMKDLNKKMVEDYLVLTNQTQNYKLVYPADFDILDQIYDAIEEILR